MIKRFRVEIELVAEIVDTIADGKNQTDNEFLLSQFVKEFVNNSEGIAGYYANYFLEQYFEADLVSDDDMTRLFNYQKDNCQALFLKTAEHCHQEVKELLIKMHKPCEKDSLDSRWQEERFTTLDSHFIPLKAVKANFYEVELDQNEGIK